MSSDTSTKSKRRRSRPRKSKTERGIMGSIKKAAAFLLKNPMATTALIGTATVLYKRGSLKKMIMGYTDTDEA